MNGKKILPFLFFIPLFFADGFCESKIINSLCLDFTQQEEITDSETSSVTQSKMSGRIIYNKNPYTFIFQTYAPVKQILFETDEGAFILEDDTIIDCSENAEFLSQICLDFLNWFKEDYGLKESFFAPALIWNENGQIISRWDYQKKDPHPIDSVIVHSDSSGRFTDLSMFTDIQASTPLTQTSLYNFEYSSGYSFPTKIVSVSYEEEKPILKTQLVFSNIQFNQNIEKQLNKKINGVINEQQGTIEFAFPEQDFSAVHKIETPQTPSQTNYRVSIPSVLVNASFKFYKKFITSQDMTNCPFYPSCSQYMLEAVSQNGVAGFFIGLERLRRCTTTEHKRNLYPTLSNGKHYDPVPVKQNKGNKNEKN